MAKLLFRRSWPALRCCEKDFHWTRSDALLLTCSKAKPTIGPKGRFLSVTGRTVAHYWILEKLGDGVGVPILDLRFWVLASRFDLGTFQQGRPLLARPLRISSFQFRVSNP